MNTENEYIKTAEDGQIYFDPTCDDNTSEIDKSKDHFNVDEKGAYFVYIEKKTIIFERYRTLEE